MDRTDLPIEAPSIDGQYIEDAIQGYKTIMTRGREALQPEITNYSSTLTDGEQVKSVRYGARTIEVDFLLMADSMEDMRDKIDHLNNLLSMDEADFVFNDESDKFYTGKPSITSDVTDYKNGLQGTYQIYCAFPFKRSVELKEISIPNTENEYDCEFLINYLGSYPSRPVLTAEFAGALEGGTYSQDGDCGYIAFIDDDENIIQLGNPDVIDVDEFALAANLANDSFSSISGWTINGGKNYKGASIKGSISVANIKDTYWKSGKGQTLPFAKPSFTSDLTTWHGPTLWKNTSGALNFEIAIVHRMCAYSSSQLGTFEVGAYNVSGSTLAMVAGVVIDKSASGTSATVRYIVNGKQVGTNTIDLSYYNTSFGYCKRTAIYKTQYYTNKKKNKKTSKKTKYSRKVFSYYKYTQSNLNTTIKKTGTQVTFKVGNLAARTFTNTEIENIPAHNISFHFGRYKGNAVLHTNAVNSVKFTNNPSEAFAEIPNVFTAGDIVEADCNDASVYIRREGTEEGQPSPQYGAVGNNWEAFSLQPGTNAIKVIWSDWVDVNYKPKVTISYNEVFL